MTEVRTAIHDRVDELREGTNPYCIARLETGWVVVSNRPLVKGHCVFYADPVVFQLNDLDELARMKYSRDVARVGDACARVLRAYRLNYETMCNVAQALHTHIYPRLRDEPEDLRRERPAVAYRESDFDLKNDLQLITDLRAALAPYALAT